MFQVYFRRGIISFTGVYVTGEGSPGVSGIRGMMSQISDRGGKSIAHSEVILFFLFSLRGGKKKLFLCQIGMSG